MGFNENTSAIMAESTDALLLPGIRYLLPVGKDHGTGGSSHPTAAQPGGVGMGGSAFLQVPTTLRCFTGFESQRLIISLLF